MTKTEMRNTYLIQRLGRPAGFVSPFSFGGCGQRNGGLRQEAADLVSRIFSFEYMGASEFEWGAVPRALERIKQYASAGRAITGTVFVREGKGVDFLCEGGTEDEVRKRIQQLYDDERRMELNEPAYLRRSVDRADENTPVGWLELDNGYMFFTDRGVYQATLQLFGLPQEEAVVVSMNGRGT